jgi:hypothetical protein
MWPEKRTAFLVIHGSGPHRPFQALDLFLRGFINVLNAQNPEQKPQVMHQLQRHEGEEFWIENYVSLVTDGQPALDFYEYYWDCCMVRDVDSLGLLKWIDNASDGARIFYARMRDKAEEYEKAEVWFFKNGNFRHKGYRALLGSFSRLRFPILLLLGHVARPVFEWATEYIDTLLGDVVIYTTSDVRSDKYEIRQKMLNGAVAQMKQLMDNNSYDQIIVAAHSLGSAIAYDAINRIMLDANTKGDPSTHASRKIAGLVTFGSPLDKIAFYFGERTGEECVVQRQILDHFHNFKKVKLAVPSEAKPSIVVKDPVKDHFERMKWLNFYHTKDFLGGALDVYNARNIRCTKPAANGSQAHASYWSWDEMYLEIGKTFF